MNTIIYRDCTIETINIYQGEKTMTQTHQEIATNKDITDLLAIGEETERNGKVDFHLFEAVFNESTMILESLKTLCRAFVDNDEMASGLPDLALVHISHGYDALNKVWEKAMEQHRAPEAEPESTTSGAKE